MIKTDGCTKEHMAEEITSLRAQVQTLTQDVSHWKHRAERFREALILAQQLAARTLDNNIQKEGTSSERKPSALRPEEVGEAVKATSDAGSHDQDTHSAGVPLTSAQNPLGAWRERGQVNDTQSSLLGNDPSEDDLKVLLASSSDVDRIEMANGSTVSIAKEAPSDPLLGESQDEPLRQYDMLPRIRELEMEVEQLKKENETLYRDRNEAIKLWDDLKNEQTQDAVDNPRHLSNLRGWQSPQNECPVCIANAALMPCPSDFCGHPGRQLGEICDSCQPVKAERGRVTGVKPVKLQTQDARHAVHQELDDFKEKLKTTPLSQTQNVYEPTKRQLKRKWITCDEEPAISCTGCGTPMIDRGAAKQWCPKCAKERTQQDDNSGVKK